MTVKKLKINRSFASGIFTAGLLVCHPQTELERARRIQTRARKDIPNEAEENG